MPAEFVNPSIVELIKKKHPDWSDKKYICTKDLNSYRAAYVRNILKSGNKELSLLDKQILQSIEERKLLSKNVDREYKRQLTFKERMADMLSDFVGSWTFILFFILIIFFWIAINVSLLFHVFDPYPFILLNLVLSCIAAIQAPIIMMSQNRQESRDRLRSEHDYQINLKAEMEIAQLQEKIDYLIKNQWQKLLEIQQVQLDLMEEMSRHIKTEKKKKTKIV